ncbi:MAG: TonB family protein [Paludibacteraceae bacterium]|nr:TonB family protein [Paludibacteraceae bacterium]
MYQGKHKCETLKAIRKQIADANEIPYEPVVCTHKGDCMGTCPACESEMRYIEDQLNIRKLTGKVVKIVGLATVMSMSACNSTDSTSIVPDEINQKKIINCNVGARDGETPFIPIEDEICADCNGFFDKVEHAVAPDSLAFYFLTNVRYKDPAMYEGIEGSVNISFIVEEDGSISNVVVKDSLYPCLDEAAVSVVNGMEKWKPAMCNGKPVRSRFHIPILFRYESLGVFIPPKTFDHCKINIPDDRDLYFVRVEKQAEFPGGKKALFEFLKANLVYSNSDLKANLDPYYLYVDYCDYDNKVWICKDLGNGLSNTIYADDIPLDTGKFYRVNVMFVVEKDGSLSNIHSSCDNQLLKEEAFRVVKKMPKWKPATIRDTVVRSKFNLPVLFKIN